jgi:hypothetical protein
MKVAQWVSFGAASRQGFPQSVDLLGGFFKEGMRWGDYLAAADESIHPYLEALRAEILRLGLHEGGDWHQDSEAGAPLFEDGTWAAFSYRAWGDLLGAVWAEAEGRDHHYMDHYMSCNVKRVPWKVAVKIAADMAPGPDFEGGLG